MGERIVFGKGKFCRRRRIKKKLKNLIFLKLKVGKEREMDEDREKWSGKRYIWDVLSWIVWVFFINLGWSFYVGGLFLCVRFGGNGTNKFDSRYFIEFVN